jgi:peptidoglycan hydrolase-like protein with peptidoglycan-binding domain
MTETDILLLDDIPVDDDDLGFHPCEEGENFDELAPGLMPFGTTSRHVKCTWLPAQLTKWGVRYKIVEGFADRGRPLSAGKFDPNGSLTHHTGSTSSAAKPNPSLSTLINGRSDLKGPLSQVATDYTGLVYLIAAGRANHAGAARATMGNPAGDGNAMYIGNEVMTNGLQEMPAAQYEATVLFAAAVADYFGQTNAAKAGLHATTSKSGKWDLGAGNGKVEPYSITKFRADVNTRLKAGPPGRSDSLRNGDRGAEVIALQKLLIAAGQNIVADGSFGPATEAALRAFQKSKGLTVDGIAWPSTIAALKAATAPATPAPVATKEITVFALVQIRGLDPVYKSDGFRLQHIGKRQLAALRKSGLEVIELADQVELDAYGVIETNPAGQK